MITNTELARAICAIGALLVAAWMIGTLFERLHQPRVIGEIVGGLLLGPTVLGAVAPDAVKWLFPAHSQALGLVQQLGLLLLLFCAGGEIRVVTRAADRMTVGTIAVVGMVIPALVGLAILYFQPLHSYWGPSATQASFVLVVCIALAVTSIPVISRIMGDLGLLKTQFAAIVLGVAVIEDIVVYVLLAVAVAIAVPNSAADFGLSSWIGLTPRSAPDIAVHIGMTLILLAAILVLGKPALTLASRVGRSAVGGSNPVTNRLLVLLAATALALVLGVEPFLAAFGAGIAVARASTPQTAAAQEVVKRFAYAFFVPVYFGLVGATLDLRHDFNIAFFVGFMIVACGVKAGSVYLAARISRRSPAAARDLAVALNARGGPGIVLATVAYAAHIVNQNFYAVLVLMAIVTSLLAGSYLAHRPKSAFEDPPDLIRAADAELAKLST